MFKSLKLSTFAPILLSGLLSCLLSGMVGVIAHAESVVELGKVKKSNSVEILGEAPVKEPIVLVLGALRTGDVELPGRLLTREERMRLRAKRAEQRQLQVATARRERRTTSRSARYHNPDDESSPPPPNSGSGDDELDIAVDEQGDPIME